MKNKQHNANRQDGQKDGNSRDMSGDKSRPGGDQHDRHSDKSARPPSDQDRNERSPSQPSESALRGNGNTHRGR